VRGSAAYLGQDDRLADAVEAAEVGVEGGLLTLGHRVGRHPEALGGLFDDYRRDASAARARHHQRQGQRNKGVPRAPQAQAVGEARHARCVRGGPTRVVGHLHVERACGECRQWLAARALTGSRRGLRVCEWSVRAVDVIRICEAITPAHIASAERMPLPPQIENGVTGSGAREGQREVRTMSGDERSPPPAC